MTIEATRPRDFLAMVDAGKATVAREIFSDEQIYQRELEKIFARAWLFMCHESQIPNAGDFFLNYMGEDRVIVVRDKAGGINVLLNTCRHRGNAVCRAEEGHATSFMCTYHGWTYDLKGALVGVPGFKDYYHEDLNREEWGLVAAPKVESYHGYVFASLDEKAPTLYDYLGEVGRIGIDIQAMKGDMKVVGGIQKYIIGCNWKLAVDNIWDWYHAQISHASSNMSGYNRRRTLNATNETPTAQANQNIGLATRIHNVLLGEYGHGISGPAATPEALELQAQSGLGAIFDNKWRERPEAREVLGPVGIETSGHPNIFPTMWITNNQISLRIPRGPFSTEIWWYTLTDANLPQETRDQQVFRANHTFGPAGMLEQEDGENWDQSTRGTRGTVSKNYPLHYGMNLGRGELREEELGPPRIITHVNEHAQLWHYRAWAEWMAADSWDELKANHLPIPTGVV